MRFNDAVIGAVLVIFAVAEILYTRTFPSLHGQAYGPRSVSGFDWGSTGWLWPVTACAWYRVQAPGVWSCKLV